MTGTRVFLLAGPVLAGILFTAAPACGQAVAQKPPTTRELHAKAWKILSEGIAGSSSKKNDAIAALTTLGTRPEAVRLVETCLTDKDPGVRETAVEALGEVEARASVSKLRRALEDDSPEVSFSAARALWDMGDRSGRDVLFEILAGERKASKGVVGSHLADAKKKVRNPLPVVRGQARSRAISKAAALLGPFGLGISVAEEFAKDNSASNRALAASTLGAHRDPRSAKELEEALSDKSWVVRAAAAKALGKLADRQSLPKLKSLLDDDKDAVRYMAAAAVVRLSQSSAGRK